MYFNIESRNNSTVIQIQSEKLDTHIAPALKSELVLVSGKGEKNIILDLEKVSVLRLFRIKCYFGSQQVMQECWWYICTLRS